ncbi:MAG: tetratricopeptide repeat protein, partial [Candidatus Omnitrophota bacterium]
MLLRNYNKLMIHNFGSASPMQLAHNSLSIAHSSLFKQPSAKSCQLAVNFRSSSPVNKTTSASPVKYNNIRKNNAGTLKALFLDKADTLLPANDVIEPESLKLLIQVLDIGTKVAVVTADSKYHAIEKELIKPLTEELRNEKRMHLVKNFHLVYARRIGSEGRTKTFNYYCRYIPTEALPAGYSLECQCLTDKEEDIVDKGGAIELLITELGISEGLVGVVTDAPKDEVMFTAKMPRGVSSVNVYVGKERVEKFIKQGVIVAPVGVRFTKATRVLFTSAIKTCAEGRGDYITVVQEMFEESKMKSVIYHNVLSLYKNPINRAHVAGVTRVVVPIAEALSVTAEELDWLRKAALLHDFGREDIDEGLRQRTVQLATGEHQISFLKMRTREAIRLQREAGVTVTSQTWRDVHNFIIGRNAREYHSQDKEYIHILRGRIEKSNRRDTSASPIKPRAANISNTLFSFSIEGFLVLFLSLPVVAKRSLPAAVADSRFIAFIFEHPLASIFGIAALICIIINYLRYRMFYPELYIGRKFTKARSLEKKLKWAKQAAAHGDKWIPEALFGHCVMLWQEGDERALSVLGMFLSEHRLLISTNYMDIVIRQLIQSIDNQSVNEQSDAETIKKVMDTLKAEITGLGIYYNPARREVEVFWKKDGDGSASPVGKCISSSLMKLVDSLKNGRSSLPAEARFQSKPKPQQADIRMQKKPVQFYILNFKSHAPPINTNQSHLRGVIVASSSVAAKYKTGDATLRSAKVSKFFRRIFIVFLLLSYLLLTLTGCASKVHHEFPGELERAEFSLHLTGERAKQIYADDNIPQKSQSYFYEGYHYYVLGDIDKAIKKFSSAIRSYPGYAAAYYQRANAYYDQEKYEKAIESYKKALNLKPKFSPVVKRNLRLAQRKLEEISEDKAKTSKDHFQDGLKHFRNKESFLAIKEFTKAIEKDSKNYKAYFYRGIIYLNIKRYDKAIENFTIVINAEPENVGAYTNRGIANNAKENYLEAIEDFTSALKINPENAKAYVNRGRSYMKLNDYDSALKDYEMVIKIEPKDIEAYINRGVLYLTTRDYDKTIQDSNFALGIDNRSLPLYLNRGIAYARKRNHDRAIEDFNIVLKIDAGNTDAYLNLGLSYLNKRKFNKAIESFDTALAINPFLKKAQNRISVVYAKEAEANLDKRLFIPISRQARDYFNKGLNHFYEKDEPALAFEAFTKALELSPKYAAAYYQRGNIYSLNKDYHGAAIDDFSRAISVAPGVFPQAYWRRGLIHYENRDYDKAIEECNLAIKADSEAEYAYSLRALIYLPKKDYQAVIEDYTQYLSLEIQDNKLLFSSKPEVAKAHKNRAFAYYMLKQYSQAIEDYTMALMIDPSIKGTENGLRAAKEQKRIAGLMSQNLNSLTLPDGRTIRYEHDNQARLKKISYPGMKDVVYTHNQYGYLTSMTDEAGKTVLAYDSSNRLEKVILPDNKEFNYSWDDNGRVTAITYPGGSRVSYSTDDRGRLSGISNKPGEIINYKYDDSNKLVQKSLPNGVRVNYGYDNSGNLESLLVKAPDGGKLFDFKYTLDALGNYTQVAETTPDTKRQTTYTYDPLYRLKSAVSSDGILNSYGYDYMGNRTFTDGAAETRQFTNNQRGNLAVRQEAGGQTHYRYDQLNRLTKIDYPDGKFKSFSYDSMDRRISITDQRNRTTDYVYSGNNLIQEIGRGGKVLAEYTYAFGSSLPVSMRRGDRDYYYIYDHLGSVIGLTDTKGRLVSQYQYDAWGNITKEIGRVENLFRFKGMQWDNQSRLYYSGETKYYAPDLGRFINKSLADETRILNPGENSYVPIALSNPTTPLITQPAQEIGLILEPETFISPEDIGKIGLGAGAGKIAERAALGMKIISKYNRLGRSWAGIGGAAVINAIITAATANQEAQRTGYSVGSVVSKGMALDVLFPAAGGFIAAAFIPATWPVLLGNVIAGFAGKAYYNFQMRRLERQYGMSLVDKPSIGSSLNKDIESSYQDRDREKRLIVPGFDDPGGGPGGGGQSGTISGAQASEEVGGILFDRAADILCDLGDITGAYWDEELGQIVLISQRKTKAEEFYLPKMDRDLLAVAIRALALQGGVNLSIDPPLSYYKTGETPENFTPMIVRYSPGTKDTLFGAIMYKADKLLKNLSAGADNETGKVVVSLVPGYKDELELIFDAIAKEKWSSSWHRVWFEIGDMFLNLDTKETSGRRALKFDRAFLEVKSKYINPYIGTNPAAEKFAEHFTLHFDEFAQEYPILERLRKLAKVVAVAKYLQQTGRLQDLSYHGRQDITKVPTPFTTPGRKSTRTRYYRRGSRTAGIYGGIDFNFRYKSRIDDGEAANLASGAKKARPLNSVYRWDFEVDGKRQSALAIPIAAKNSYSSGYRDIYIREGVELVRVYNSFNNSPTMFGYGWRLSNPVNLERLAAAGVKIKYDSLKRVSKITLENGRVIYYDYDRYGDLVRVRDTTGKTVTYAYNSEHRLIKIKDGGRVILRQNYDSLGSIIRKRQEKTVDSQGKIITRSYDQQYRLIKEEDGRGNSVSYEYDENNNLRKTIMLGNNTKKTIFEHDTEERIIKVTYPFGQNVSLTYDDLGNRTSFTGQNTNTTKFGYDAEGRLISITDAAGATTRYGYDNSGSLNSVTYPNRETVHYEYDSKTRSLRIKKENRLPLSSSPILSRFYPDNKKGDVTMRCLAFLPILPLTLGAGSLFSTLTGGHTVGGFVLGLLALCGVLIVIRYMDWLIFRRNIGNDKSDKIIYSYLQDLMNAYWSKSHKPVFVMGQLEGAYQQRETVFKIVESKFPMQPEETYLLLKPNTPQTQSLPAPSMSFHFALKRYPKPTENTYIKGSWLIHKPKLSYGQLAGDFYSDKQNLTQALEELTHAAEIIEAKPSVEAKPQPGSSRGATKQGYQGNLFRNQIQRITTVMKRKIIQIRRKIKIVEHYILNFKSHAPPRGLFKILTFTIEENNTSRVIFSKPAFKVSKEKIKTIYGVSRIFLKIIRVIFSFIYPILEPDNLSFLFHNTWTKFSGPGTWNHNCTREIKRLRNKDEKTGYKNLFINRKESNGFGRVGISFVVRNFNSNNRTGVKFIVFIGEDYAFHNIERKSSGRGIGIPVVITLGCLAWALRSNSATSYPMNGSPSATITYWPPYFSTNSWKWADIQASSDCILEALVFFFDFAIINLLQQK